MPGKHKASRAADRLTVRLLDPGDGSGDRLLEIPDAVMEATGWNLGDSLVVTRKGLEIRLRKGRKSRWQQKSR